MWAQRWKTISRAITVLQEALGPFYAAAHITQSDNLTLGNGLIIPQARAIFAQIENFQDVYRNALPPEAATALASLVETCSRIMKDVRDLHGPALAVTMLVTIRATMELYMADTESVGRSITERAFAHLQRSIVADASVRDKWKKAFKKGETECEKLGAVHLLAHGIWAFKIDAAGARTDLVYNNALDIAQAERTAPYALVLTEWKTATDATVGSQFESAVRQAELYAAGALADLELTRTRYIVVVTTKQAKCSQGDKDSNGVTYRFVNIAVDPAIPSVAAKRKR